MRTRRGVQTYDIDTLTPYVLTFIMSFGLITGLVLLVMTVLTVIGKWMVLSKLGKRRITFGWRRIERVIYEADDGSYWARYSDQWNELGVTTYDGNLHFHGDWLRFAN